MREWVDWKLVVKKWENERVSGLEMGGEKVGE